MAGGETTFRGAGGIHTSAILDLVPVDLLDDRFGLASHRALSLAETFGTPLYVLDEDSIRHRARRYQAAFRAAFPRVELAYACKANSTLAALKILHQEGFAIDVASIGELEAARRAGIPASDCHLHGNYKTDLELAVAIGNQIGAIMVDSLDEIEQLRRLQPGQIECVLRLAPGVAPDTHHRISTGQADTKFGFNIADGSAEAAVRASLAAGLNLKGFHCHVGSQLLDPDAQRGGGEELAKFALEMRQLGLFTARYLNLGGGIGVRYTDADHPMPVEDYCKLVVQAVIEPLQASGYPIDQLTLAQEPGRYLVAETGVTLYRVGPVKQTPVRTYVAVDGGLSDNPRPAMYEAQYDVELIRQGERAQWDVPVDGPGAVFGSPGLTKVTISGRHCETDELFRDVELPADVQNGDLVQVFTTGAYNSSMSSNYNRFTRPATVLLRPDGTAELVQARETIEQLFQRESLPKDLQ